MILTTTIRQFLIFQTAAMPIYVLLTAALLDPLTTWQALKPHFGFLVVYIIIFGIMMRLLENLEEETT